MARLFAAAVDDDLRDAEYLSSLVREWAEEREEELTLALYSSAEAFLFAYEADRRLSLLFLDVEMPGMDGVELAKRVREGNREVKIIFVTGYSDYILEGYDVAALHYLMKPVAKEKLFQVLDRACREIAEDDRALYLRERDGITRIPLREIVYAEVFHNDVTIHAREIHRKRMTLGDLEKELSPEAGFFRIGRSYLLNLAFVSRTARSEVTLTDGTRLPLPRGQYELLNRAIIERGRG